MSREKAWIRSQIETLAGRGRERSTYDIATRPADREDKMEEDSDQDIKITTKRNQHKANLGLADSKHIKKSLKQAANMEDDSVAYCPPEHTTDTSGTNIKNKNRKHLHPWPQVLGGEVKQTQLETFPPSRWQCGAPSTPWSSTTHSPHRLSALRVKVTQQKKRMEKESGRRETEN
jgi:hypothetical protein